LAKTINAILNLQDKFTPKLSQAKKEALLFKARMNDCDSVSKSFEKGLGKIGDAAKKGFAVASAASLGFAASSVQVYKGFEQSMSNVAGTLAIDKSSDDYAKLEQAARDAGKSTTKSATEAADALNYMALAGWSVEESTTGLMPMLRAAEAANEDLGTVSDAVTDSMSALGLQVSDMQRYLDVGAKAQSKSNQNLMQFQEAMIGVGGTFNNFNTGIEEGGALLGVLANRGIKGSEAGNALQSTIVNLTKKSGESAKAMSALGISAYDSEGNFKGVTAVLTELNDKLKGLDSDEQRKNYLTMIGGKSQLTTLNALMAGLNTTVADGRTELQYLQDELKDSDGSLDKLSATMTDNLNGSWATFTSAVQEAQIALGEKLAPYLKQGLNWLTDKVPKVQEVVMGFIDEKLPVAIDTAKVALEKIKPVVKWLIEHWKGLAIAGGTVVTFMKTFTVANKVYKTFDALKTAANGASVVTTGLKTAMFGLNTSFLACPVTWVAAGIAAAIGVVVLLATKSERLRKALSKVWNIAKGFGKEIGDKLKSAFERVKTAFGGTDASLTKIGDALGWIVEKSTPVLEFLMGLASSAIMKGIDIIADGFEIVAKWIDSIGYAIDGVKALFRGDIVGAMDAFSLCGVNAAEAIKTALGNIPGPFGKVIDVIKEAKRLLGLLLTEGWQPFKDAVVGDIKKLVDKFQTLVDKIKVVKDALWQAGIDNGKKTYEKAQSGNNLGGYLYESSKDNRNVVKGIVEEYSNGGNYGTYLYKIAHPEATGNNALGTSYWKGGPTWVNERGGEIIDLPTGSRVIPADKSSEMIREGNKNITFNITVNSNGNTEQDKELADRIARRVLDAMEGV
jgi:TP901 family phage tail tape measure protein